MKYKKRGYHSKKYYSGLDIDKDTLALAPIHFSEIVKAELASNIFDECGHGVADKSHSRYFDEMLTDLGLQQLTPDVWVDDWRPYAGHNLYFLLGLSRKHYFKSIESLVRPELFAPNRDRLVVGGLDRLYAGKVNYHFYSSHIDTMKRMVYAGVTRRSPQLLKYSHLRVGN